MDTTTGRISGFGLGFADTTNHALDRLGETRPDVDRDMHGLMLATRVLMWCESDHRHGLVNAGEWQKAMTTLAGFRIARGAIQLWDALRSLFEQDPDWATAHILQYVGQVKQTARVESSSNN